jgi:hypothetical protein
MARSVHPGGAEYRFCLPRRRIHSRWFPAPGGDLRRPAHEIIAQHRPAAEQHGGPLVLVIQAEPAITRCHGGITGSGVLPEPGPPALLSCLYCSARADRLGDVIQAGGPAPPSSGTSFSEPVPGRDPQRGRRRRGAQPGRPGHLGTRYRRAPGGRGQPWRRGPGTPGESLQHGQLAGDAGGHCPRTDRESGAFSGPPGPSAAVTRDQSAGHPRQRAAAAPERLSGDSGPNARRDSGSRTRSCSSPRPWPPGPARAPPTAVSQRRNRRDDLNNTHPDPPSQFFEAQLAGGADEEIG